MEEQEVNVEQLHEIVHEQAHKSSWAEKVALTTALLAVFAAISSLLSTYESDQAILFRIEASDRWSYYQAKGIKGMVTQEAAEKAQSAPFCRALIEGSGPSVSGSMECYSAHRRNRTVGPITGRVASRNHCRINRQHGIPIAQATG